MKYLVVLVILFSGFWHQAVAQVPAGQGAVADSIELRALRALYDSTDGPHWTNAGYLARPWTWSSSPAMATVATWFGVTVTSGDVTGLNLPFNNLKGHLPAEILTLRKLQYLLLYQNKLSGPLPLTWQQLPELRQLQLHNNTLQGLIPPQLGQMPLLTYLTLNNNQFSGYLPTELGQARALQTLSVSTNRLTGSIPPQWQSLRQLRSLGLAFNGLNGALPTWMSRFRQLAFLDLRSNQFSGTLPDSLGTLPVLAQLWLQNNRFSGAVPASYATLPVLRECFLDNNALTALPSFLASPQASSLKLQVPGNRLDFADIERNLTGPRQAPFATFAYGSQLPALSTDTLSRPVGVTVALTRSTGGSRVHYQWQKRVGLTTWVDVPGDTLLALHAFPATPADETSYRVKASDRWADPTAFVYSRNVYLAILPYAPLPLNLPQQRSAAALLTALLPAPAVPTPDPTINYVRTWTPRVALQDTAQVTHAGYDSVAMTTTYLDGLGRPVQSVARAASPLARDVVQLIEYDALGRQPRDYLPYSAAPISGSVAGGYRPGARYEQSQFYAAPAAGPTAGLPRTAVGFAERVYEESPLERVRAMGAPGETGHVSASHAAIIEERPNTAADSVHRWRPGFGTTLLLREGLAHEGEYAPGELWVTITTDENGLPRRTFTDKGGQVVLEQTAANQQTDNDGLKHYSWLSTCFIYDDFGRQRAVLPPMAVQLVRRNNWEIGSAGVELLLTRTHYDARGRANEMRRPDASSGAAGYTYVVFDGLDRPILTQTPAQRPRQEWSVTKYDALGRVVVTALLYRSAAPSTLQTEADAWAPTAGWEAPATSAGAGGAFYTDQAYPKLTTSGVRAQVLTVTYYDDYDFNRDGTADIAYNTADDSHFGAPLSPPVPDARTRGRVTRTRVRLLPATSAAAEWLETATFYDEYGHAIQTLTSRPQAGGNYHQRQTAAFTFAGEVPQSVLTTTGPNHPAVTLIERRRYDHAGRVLQTTQQVDGQPEVALARQQYNELGQLQRKILGGRLSDSSGWQVLDYRYHIRGWLTHLNGLPLGGDQQADSVAASLFDARDLFSLRLSYEHDFTDRQYGGNLSGQTWRSAGDGVIRAFGYRYDVPGRLLQADFAAYSPVAFAFSDDINRFRFSAASYDANGNLLTLRRRGQLAAATRNQAAQFGETDNLRYTYLAGANRLTHVDDLALAAPVGTPAALRSDVQDRLTAAATTAELTYDPAGSATKVSVEGLNALTYNHLALNQRISFAAAGDSLVYRWAADGTKVGATRYVGGVARQRTAYVGGGAWVYEQDSLRYWRTGEGRALWQPTNATYPVAYEYAIADHLGNVRVSFRPGERKSRYATLAQDQSVRETQEFDSLSIERPRTAVDLNYAADGFVARLTAAGPAPVPFGPTTTQLVQKGDTIHAEAYFSYDPAGAGGASVQVNLLSLVASWLTQTPPSSPDGRTQQPSLPWVSVALGTPLWNGLWSNQVPRAYLRMVAFNADSQIVAERVVPITSSAAGNWQLLTAELIAPTDGRVLVYVATESERAVDVDEVRVRYQPNLQVQEQHYDPFGLELVGLSRNGLVPTNRYLFNGKEAQAELGLTAWTDHGWRMFDAALGRWHVVDPAFDKAGQISWTSYQFGLDNPVRYNDLDGKVVVAADEKSKQAILGTLRQRQRDKIKFDENGKIDATSIKSTFFSHNARALKKLAKSDEVYIAKTDNHVVSDVDGKIVDEAMGPVDFDPEWGKITGFKGATRPRLRNEQERMQGAPYSPDENTYVVINETLSPRDQSTVMSHELYGHAYLFDLGKKETHEFKSKNGGLKEKNGALRRQIRRSQKATERALD